MCRIRIGLQYPLETKIVDRNHKLKYYSLKGSIPSILMSNLVTGGLSVHQTQRRTQLEGKNGDSCVISRVGMELPLETNNLRPCS